MWYNNQNKMMDYGPKPYVVDVERAAKENSNFRMAVWTGEYVRMTLMYISPADDIGWEIHEDTDQMIRVEQGTGMVSFGDCKGHPYYEEEIHEDDVVFVPVGTWHNVMNIGECPLRVSSTYAPPHHPRGGVEEKKS